MLEYGMPVAYALFTWWFSTGLILYLNGLPRRTFRWSVLGASALAAVALYGLAASSKTPTVAGAYIAFTSALIVWGWQEISYYMDLVTGPRKQSCRDGCDGWQHFGHAIQTSLYHELAVIAGAVVIAGITWGEPNQIGTWTYVVLWLMRWSAKLNVFLGVRNLNVALLPEHMWFLKSFMTRKPMNLLFPMSVTVSTIVAAILVQRASAADVSPFGIAGFTFLAALIVLAIIEHWFLMLPLPSEALWGWGLRSRADRRLLDAEVSARSAGTGGSTCVDAAPVCGGVTPSTHWRGR